MDSDTHKIYGDYNSRINDDKPVNIGENVWIGCRSTILKGSTIPDNCVLAAGSIMTGRNDVLQNSIVAGNPPKTVKPILNWTE